VITDGLRASDESQTIVVELSGSSFSETRVGINVEKTEA
jgi:hypothetical protein